MPVLNKKRLAAEIERDRRQRLRQRLAELGALIRAARAARREAIAAVKVQCRVARGKLRSVCATRVTRARARGEASIAASRLEADEANASDQVIRTVDRQRRGGVRSTASERRSESDDQVRANLPSELIAVFDRVRKHLPPSAWKSRTESFLQWAEENPGEVYAIQGELAERDLARLLAEQARAERASRSRRKLASGEVPF